MNREIFRETKGFEGLYVVSNCGNIKRLETQTTSGSGNYSRQEHFLKQRKNNKGYCIVDLYKNNIRHQLLVHRIVAQNFIENPNNLPCVNHKDENKENNNVENLEWCTHKYNMNYGNCPQKITGISNGNIGDCLHKRRKSAGGYLWEYEK